MVGVQPFWTLRSSCRQVASRVFRVWLMFGAAYFGSPDSGAWKARFTGKVVDEALPQFVLFLQSVPQLAEGDFNLDWAFR
jgi:hypothetical protein